MSNIKTYGEFLNESENNSDLLKLSKQLKFPSGSKSTHNGIEWSKRSGHAGSKMVSKTLAAAKELGWKHDFKQTNDATGDKVTNHNVLYDKEGLYKLAGYSHYGNTAYDNSYSLRLEKINSESK